VSASVFSWIVAVSYLECFPLASAGIADCYELAFAALGYKLEPIASYCVLCIVYCVLCIVYCVLCIVYFAAVCSLPSRRTLVQYEDTVCCPYSEQRFCFCFCFWWARVEEAPISFAGGL